MYEEMLSHYALKEDRLPSILLVRFSTKISNKINTIITYNQNNIEAITKWREYLEGIKRYLSNPVIAWDYTNRFSRFPNGGRFVREFDYNVAYVIKTNNVTQQAYVYIFIINLNAEEFGLKLPPTLNENKKIIPLTESYIRHIVRETLRQYLQL